MKDKINVLLDILNLSVSSFSKEIGEKRADNIYNILNKDTSPNSDLIRKIKQRYPEVNLNWLLGCDDEPPIVHLNSHLSDHQNDHSNDHLNAHISSDVGQEAIPSVSNAQESELLRMTITKLESVIVEYKERIAELKEDRAELKSEMKELKAELKLCQQELKKYVDDTDRFKKRESARQEAERVQLGDNT